MPASPSPERATGRAPRGRNALPLSVALHAAAFYGFAHVPWASVPLPHAVEAASVVWLVEPPSAERPEPPPTARPEPPLPDIFAPAPDEPAASNSAVAPEPRPAARPPAPRRPATRESRPSPPQSEATEPTPTEPIPTEPAAPTEQTTAPPPVDWEKERQAAARSVIQEHAGERRRPLDDAGAGEESKPAEPTAPATTALVDDGCKIATTRAQRFVARMMGRCVRGPRGDMFAAIMPEYLKVRPVCFETHPEAPGSVLADGSVISTVKCELVRKGAPEPLPEDIPTDDESLARAGAQ